MTDYARINEEARIVWDGYNKGNPSRVPVTIYADARNWLHEQKCNTERITLPQYLKSPELMAHVQVRTKEWVRLNILSDDGVGYPTADEGWPLIVDFQNFLEPAWLGGEVIYNDEPHCRPFLEDAKGETSKYAILERGAPEPFSGIMQDVLEYYEYFVSLRSKGFEYKGIPIGHISLPYNMTGTDGPFTLCCGMRGAEGIICDMLEEPEYAHALMGLVTDAVIARIKAARRYLGQDEVQDYCGIADDAIAMLGTDFYMEFVLPYHRRIYEALSRPGAYRGVHLCGNAQRFFGILQKELGVKDFDTGFPVDFERLYDELTPDTRVNGGVEAGILLNGTPDEVLRRAKEILSSGVIQKSKKFVLREANALSPGTPLENVNMLYHAAVKYGTYM